MTNEIITRLEPFVSGLGKAILRELDYHIESLKADVFVLTGEVANKADYAARMYHMYEEIKTEQKQLNVQSYARKAMIAVFDDLMKSSQLSLDMAKDQNAEIDDLRAALHVTVVCGHPNPLTAWRNGCYARYEAMKSILSHEEKLVILAFIDGA